jgi:hypothetical protein
LAWLSYFVLILHAPFWCRIQKLPDLVKSFFRQQEVRYAAD